MTNPLKTLSEAGQSVWIDLIRRDLIRGGRLKRWIEEDGLKGMTSNPAIFEKAMGHGTDYDSAMESLLDGGTGRDLDAVSLYERLAIEDIQGAADLFRPVYEQTGGVDGFVSLEVSPGLARNAEGSVREGRRLWKEVGRPNLMIKIPATEEGLPAIRQLLSEGINVNVTLLFSRDRYVEVIEAFLAGAEAWVSSGGDPRRLASVASFFVSRIDKLVDQLIGEQIRTFQEQDAPRAELLRSLQGRIAIANAKLAYRVFLERLSPERDARWARLARQGVRPQRLLWASTSTKNPAYPDTLYVDELIGPHTVTTLPLETFDAFREHGRVRPTLTEGVEEAQRRLEALDEVRISLSEVTEILTREAIVLFSEPFDRLIGVIERKRREKLGHRINGFAVDLPAELQTEVDDRLRQAASGNWMKRLWERDASLWTGRDESQWLGWLDIPVRERSSRLLTELREFAARIREEGFRDVCLLGMGGSSLAPDLYSHFFDPAPGFPRVHVLDSTDPGRILEVEGSVDLSRTLFVVSSKSGTTIEPSLLFEYFWGRLSEHRGRADPETLGPQFVAVTDPGSPLEKRAGSLLFRKVFHGEPSIAGRYSALSVFGLLPAALMGVDPGELLEHVEPMRLSCLGGVPPWENPGARLGICLGVLAQRGRDKVTFVCSERLSGLELWLEQLLAESTGKQGKGLIPISREPLGVPECYGKDRIFVHLKLLEGVADAGKKAAREGREREIDDKLLALRRSGQPVFQITVREPMNLTQEIFRWEMATAVASSVLGVNPFDQPDVESAKLETRELTEQYEKQGRLKPEFESWVAALDGGDGASIALFSDRATASRLAREPRRIRPAGPDASSHPAEAFVSALAGFLGQGEPSDYLALLAYVQPLPRHDAELQRLRLMIRNHLRIATSLQYGPRYLHSVGQVFKGGPERGLFLVLTCDDAIDVPVPSRRLSFGTVKLAQAQGDFRVLLDRGRRALRLHLGNPVAGALAELHPILRRALERIHPLNNQVNTEGLNREFSRLNPRRRMEGSA